jgi:hypothetical protein
MVEGLDTRLVVCLGNRIWCLVIEEAKNQLPVSTYVSTYVLCTTAWNENRKKPVATRKPVFSGFLTLVPRTTARWGRRALATTQRDDRTYPWIWPPFGIDPTTTWVSSAPPDPDPFLRRRQRWLRRRVFEAVRAPPDDVRKETSCAEDWNEDKNVG